MRSARCRFAVTRPIAVIALLLLASFAAMPVRTTAQETAVPAEAESFPVEAVEDGDKFSIDTGSETVTVNLIGTDAPEPDECYAAEATAALGALVGPGVSVSLDGDAKDEDGKGRWLRYAWVTDEAGAVVFVNEHLIRQGFATYKAKDADDGNARYAEQFRAAEEDAKQAKRGLWGVCGGGHVALSDVPTPAPTRDPNAPKPPKGVPADAVDARVWGWIDARSFKVRIGDATEELRLIGVDAPLLARADGPPDCYGAEALAHLQTLVAKKETVWLEADGVDRDSKERLLRYVWVVPEEGKPFLLNTKLVRDGAATFGAVKGADRYDDNLKKAEKTAKEKDAGLWGACGGNHVRVTPTPTPAPEPTAAPIPTEAPAPAANCDPSYPTVCIPPPPPDLNCPDVPYTDFQVVGSDPHGFDRDNDGIGCES